MKMPVAFGPGADEGAFTAAAQAIHTYFLWRLAPLFCCFIGQKFLAAEDTAVKAMRHLSAGRAFGDFAPIIVLDPVDMYRLRFPVLLVIVCWLVLAAVAVKPPFADEAFIPMAIPCAAPKINHFLHYPPSLAAPAGASSG